MKISERKFPNISKETSLLVVSALNKADFYFVDEGQIKKIAECSNLDEEIPQKVKVKFKNRGGGMLVKMGGLMNSRSEEERHRFLSLVAKTAASIKHEFNKAYIYAPSAIIYALEKILPNRVSSKITRRFRGNYLKQHPTKLLNMLKERRATVSKNKSKHLSARDLTK